MTTSYPMAGFVLVGGESSRMGEDKALLTVKGQTLVSRAAELLKPLCASVSLIGPRSRYESSGIDMEILDDEVEPCGPLGGILTGLRHTTHDYALFLACDLPLMTEKFLRYLVGATMAEKPSVTVPVDASGEYQPLCAVYSRHCLPAIERSVGAQQYKVSAFYDSVEKLRVIGSGEVRRFSPDFGIFSNVNTPEEWATVRQAVELK